MNDEDFELEQRRTEYLLEKGDRELKIQQEDEVLYGAHKIGSNTAAFLDRYQGAELKDNE